ncbi:hypothetical protein DRO24_00670 [Candidatus Bathyarchaeota archaeon]|nr:MAG: hypothetical protein DRO24_00670 [Candidatus Bathyarchaeota archaeon]
MRLDPGNEMTKKNTLMVYVSIAAETIATKNFIEAKEFSEKALSLIPRGEITEHARKIIEMIEMHSGPKKISSSPISRKELEKVTVTSKALEKIRSSVTTDLPGSQTGILLENT